MLESSEEEERVQKPTSKKTSRDLVAKKRTSGKVSGKGKKKLRKGGVPSAVGTGKKVLAQKDSGRKHAVIQLPWDFSGVLHH